MVGLEGEPRAAVQPGADGLPLANEASTTIFVGLALFGPPKKPKSPFYEERASTFCPPKKIELAPFAPKKKRARPFARSKSKNRTLWRTEKDLWGWAGGAQATGFGADFA